MESETDLSGRENHLPNLHFSGLHVIHVEICEGCTVDDVAATIKGNFSQAFSQSRYVGASWNMSLPSI